MWKYLGFKNKNMLNTKNINNHFYKIFYNKEFITIKP